MKGGWDVRREWKREWKRRLREVLRGDGERALEEMKMERYFEGEARSTCHC